MNEVIINGLMYLMCIVLSVITIIVFTKISKLMDILGKIIGIHYIRSKSKEYFKSKLSYRFLNLTSTFTLYIWLFSTIYLFYNFLFRFNFEYLIWSIEIFILVPLLYRANIIFQMFIHKKK